MEPFTGQAIGRITNHSDSGEEGMRPTLPVIGRAAAVALLFAAVVITASHSIGQAPSYSTVQGHRQTVDVLPTSGPPMSRGDALALVQRDTAEVKTIARIASKLTTWSSYVNGLDNMAPDHTSPVDSMNVPPSRKIWMVAVAGAIAPAYDAAGETRPWAVFVLDAGTGTSLGMQAGPSGTWPPYFDAIIDLG
jgi:hypothetical protein